MRIIIFANGVIENPEAAVTRWVRTGDLIVAANGGTLHVLSAGRIPDHVIGDVDSLDETLVAHLTAEGTIFHTHPPAKDETDLELALLWAAAQEAGEIIVLGALGGRPDQMLANILLLGIPELAGKNVMIAENAWEICVVREGETGHVEGQVGDIVSLAPLGGDVYGVTTQGLEYPLVAEMLYFGPARGISNAMVEDQAEVQVHGKACLQKSAGLLWIFHRAGASET
ncbi:MAG: thiamine diphosphokinase [Anaerolineae bacterium]|nr:thiamine diphosphokinase [Anaerolineae bacterium]